VTPLNFILVLITEGFGIGGQVFFKHAMGGDHSRRVFVKLLGAGIFLKAFEFFLWLGLLGKFDLSYLYPFDALSRLMLVVAAWVFLKERATPQIWLGAGLITVGVALVSAT
jgi:uncharacterized membrane protein